MAYPSRPKYGNKKTAFDGLLFDSKKEAEVYAILKKTKDVTSIGVHPRFTLLPSFKYKKETHRAINIEPDFVVQYKDGRTEVWEVKGGNATRTQAWKIKWKMFLSQYGDKFSDIVIV